MHVGNGANHAAPVARGLPLAPPHPEQDGAPTSGPSAGAEIAFHSDPGGNDDTYLMRADGSHATGLTFRKETVARPVWSPDGSGERVLRGSEGVANDCCAAWRPQP